MRDGAGAEPALQVSSDAHDGALGEAGLHPHPPTTPRHAQASIPDGQASVSARGAVPEILYIIIICMYAEQLPYVTLFSGV